MKTKRVKTESASVRVGDISHEADEIQEEEEDRYANCTGSLYRMSIANGKLEFQLEFEVPTLPIPASKFDSSAVFVVDIGLMCFIWIGNAVDDVISKNGMIIAHNYLQKSSHPLIPVTIVKEGREPKNFKRVVHN
ncbi:gelsolin-like protein 2 [Amphiura filiformis]|uniref:gelsolin-like protein 2 n=1 Tax=Amphiura filiformis TaxID=82378 RepID=UPI003B220C71